MYFLSLHFPPSAFDEELEGGGGGDREARGGRTTRKEGREEDGAGGRKLYGLDGGPGEGGARSRLKPLLKLAIFFALQPQSVHANLHLTHIN